MKYQIDDNVPLPDSTRHGWQPFSDMEIGQSFEVKGYALFTSLQARGHAYGVVCRKRGEHYRIVSRGHGPFSLPQAHPDYRNKQWHDEYVGRIWRIE